MNCGAISAKQKLIKGVKTNSRWKVAVVFVSLRSDFLNVARVYFLIKVFLAHFLLSPRAFQKCILVLLVFLFYRLIMGVLKDNNCVIKRNCLSSF